MKKYKNTFKYLNQVENLLILVSVLTCVSISAFGSLLCVPVGITSSAVGIKICAITARIKKYKSIIKKEKKKHEKMVLLGKDKLKTIAVLISMVRFLVNYDEFISVNVLRECNEKKK